MEMTLEKILLFLDKVVYGNSLQAWIFSFSVMVLLFFGLKVLRRLLRRRLPLLRGLGHANWEKIGEYILRSTKTSFLFLLSVWFGARFLTLSPSVAGLVQKLLVLVFLYQAAIWANFIIQYLVEDYATRSADGDADKAGTLRAASGLLKLIVVVALSLFALDNMGVNVTTLIAGLGIGGVAIGLASQKILSDLFSSISIILDKPFVQGDSITVGPDSGTIERIGLKTTRIRSTSGEELSFPNSDLLQSRIRNFRRMNERRVVLRFGVTYQTKVEQLRAIPKLVAEVVGKQEQARFDRAHFYNYGDSSLDYEVIYWIRRPDNLTYMDTQQSVNLDLFSAFEKAEIDFAYPTRTVFVTKTDASEARP